MTQPLLRRLGVLALCTYVGLLSFAAWDEAIRPDVLDDAHRTVRDALARVRLQPGAALFAGNGDHEYKQEHLCPIVLAHDEVPGPATDSPSLLWTCDRAPLPFFTDPLEHGLMRIFESSHFGLRSPDPGVRRAAETGYQVVGDFFCHRPPSPAAVSLLLYRSDVSWQTGERYEEVTWEYRWDCAGAPLADRPDVGALLEAAREGSP